MTVLSMSNDEIFRMTVLRDLAERRLRVSQAAEQLQLGNRQVLRLAKAFKKHGVVALVSRRRGQPGNHRFPAELRSRTLTIIRERYATLARSSLPKSSAPSMTSTCPAKR